MKNTLFLFTALLLIAFASCSDGSNDIPDPIIRIDSGITSNGIYCSNQAGERAIDFTTYADWTLSITDDSWCVPSENPDHSYAAEILRGQSHGNPDTYPPSRKCRGQSAFRYSAGYNPVHTGTGSG